MAWTGNFPTTLSPAATAADGQSSAQAALADDGQPASAIAMPAAGEEGRCGDADTALAAVVPADELGFADLIRRNEAMVFSLAFYFLRDAAEAEELAQDVFLALYRHRGSIESPRHLLHWLRQVTCRRCLDRRRRQRPLFSYSSLDRMDNDWPAMPAPQADPWLARRLRQLVGALPARMRMVMVLRYQQDLDPEEIARLLRLPRATVKSHLRRGLARLRRRLPEAARPGHAGATRKQGVTQ